MIHVIVVEDDPMVMEITCGYIQSVPGFQVVGRAGSGPEALELLKKQKADLLILDVYMPVMNGVELLTALRAAGTQADAIFLTAAKDKPMIDRALKLGAVDYLIKPFGYERFKSALSNYEARFRLLRGEECATQEELDRLLGLPVGAGAEAQMQKGLHGKTLDYIRQCIRDGESELICAEDIMQKLEVSKSTARRYLDYLASIGELVLQIEYGSVGRPTYRYRRIQ